MKNQTAAERAADKLIYEGMIASKRSLIAELQAHPELVGMPTEIVEGDRGHEFVVTSPRDRARNIRRLIKDTEVEIRKLERMVAELEDRPS